MRALALSALDWWDEAGVDTLVDEHPRDWLARPSTLPPLGVSAAAVVARSAPVPAVAYPADLPGFRRWLLQDPAVPGPVRARHDAVGDPASGCMVVVDMPESVDRGTAQLLTGDAGALFDRMLDAIGLARDRIYLAPFAPARPATGQLNKTVCATLEPLMRHHLALVAPRRVLLLGDAPACALIGAAVAQSRERVHHLSINGADVPAVASFPPRLVQGKDLRRSAWADLQLFRELA